MFVTAKLVFTSEGRIVTRSQQTGGVNSAVDSRWTAGELVCQEMTTCPWLRAMPSWGALPEEAAKLSAKTLWPETSVVSEESPMTAMLIVLASPNPQSVPISSERSNVQE